MTYLLIAVVVMVALSPLLSMMPTRRQRQIADLRQQAALSGLLVQLRALPDSADSTGLHPFYARRRQRGDRVASIAVYRRAGDGWSGAASDTVKRRWRPVSIAMATLLAQLPKGVSHVCENLHDIGMFWDEEGTQADIEQMVEVLEKLLKQDAPGNKK